MTADFDPTTMIGDFAYSWQAGPGDGQSRVFNVRTDEDTDEILAEDQHARRLGIGGVPCFIVDGKYALSGAQEAESFLPIIDMAVQEAAQEPATQA